MEFKQTIAIDFDGVLNNYSGYDEKELGTIRDGCKEFIEEISKDYTIIIFTSRNHTHVENWIRYYHLDKYIRNVTNTKPPAVAYIDDRGLRFNGNYTEILESLKDINPYWKK